MDTFSSGEDLNIKTRKPYTITKQRERWTEEEHNRFLEALKLYGRAWQSIEEHIGTKTAVQIRSHAQKFFSKLEKEAITKGIPLEQAFDIEIPPPRPKRKPTNPYPRKTSAGATTSSQLGTTDEKLVRKASPFWPGEQKLDLENEPPQENPRGAEKSGSVNEIQNDDNCSEVLTLFQEAPCTSVSSASKNSTVVHAKPCILKEFVPMMKNTSDLSAINESYLTVEPKGNWKYKKTDVNPTDMDNSTSETENTVNCSQNSREKLVQEESTDRLVQPEELGEPSTIEMQAFQDYPMHVPSYVANGIIGSCLQTPDMTNIASILHPVGGVHGIPNLFIKPTAAATNDHHSNMSTPCIHQEVPAFRSLSTQIHNKDDNQSFLHFSTTFSSLLLSTVLQNPAAYAAATATSSFWPCSNVGTSQHSPAETLGGFPLHMSPSLSMAALATATVAAASAWWAAHGLLPLCPSLHTGFTCPPASTTVIPSVDTGQTPAVTKERKDNTPQDYPLEDQQLDPEFSKNLIAQVAAAKSPPLPLSDSGESRGVGSNSAGLKVDDHEQKPIAVTELHDTNKTKTSKLVDRSSCGSNGPSSSEVETDALEKHEKGNDESKEPDVSHPATEPNNHRSKNNGNMNESWKEVSQGGKLAFQALFSREILPQSFPPLHDLSKGHQKNPEEGMRKFNERDEELLQLYINSTARGTCTIHQGVEKNETLRGDDSVERGLLSEGHQKNLEKGMRKFDEKDGEETLQLDLDLNSKIRGTCTIHQGVEKDKTLRGDDNVERRQLILGLGHGKLKVRRMGFKPYKRCSVEAQGRIANASNQGEEKGPKRIRIEGEASTS